MSEVSEPKRRVPESELDLLGSFDNHNADIDPSLSTQPIPKEWLEAIASAPEKVKQEETARRKKRAAELEKVRGLEPMSHVIPRGLRVVPISPLVPDYIRKLNKGNPVCEGNIEEKLHG